MAIKQRLRAVFILVILCMIGGGIWFWQSKRNTVSDNELLLYGNVDIRQVELAFNDSERIAELLVEEGDRLKKGQLLAKLETERFELAVTRADAQVKTQEQVVARLEAGTRPEEIRKAKADVAAGAAALDDAARTYKRISVLVPQKAASVQNLDDARAAVNSARARLNALNAILDLAIAGPRKEDIAAAKALLKRYQAELALAQRDLKNAFLYAPTDGIVQSRILEVGDMASPQKPVYTVALTNPLWVRVYISEPDLGKIREGMQAAVTTDSFPNKQYEGRIGFISPTAEFTPKPVETTEIRTKLVYQVRVFVKNPNDELRLGMPATVRVQLDQPRPIKDQPPTGDSAAGQIIGMGLLISTLARNQFVAGQVAIITTFLPAFILSGFIFDIGSMPPIIRAITYLIPARYFVAILQTVFLAGDVWPVILPNVLALMVMALVFIGLTRKKTHKRLD